MKTKNNKKNKRNRSENDARSEAKEPKEPKRISVEDYNQQCSDIIEKNKSNPEWFPDTLLELLEFAGKCTIVEAEKEDADLKPITKDELDIINNEYARGYNDALEMATKKLNKVTKVSQKDRSHKKK